MWDFDTVIEWKEDKNNEQMEELFHKKGEINYALSLR